MSKTSKRNRIVKDFQKKTFQESGILKESFVHVNKINETTNTKKKTRKDLPAAKINSPLKMICPSIFKVLEALKISRQCGCLHGFTLMKDGDLIRLAAGMAFAPVDTTTSIAVITTTLPDHVRNSTGALNLFRTLLCIGTNLYLTKDFAGAHQVYCVCTLLESSYLGHHHATQSSDSMLSYFSQHIPCNCLSCVQDEQRDIEAFMLYAGKGSTSTFFS
mmetsp:Transcript_32544/g.46255  ORF Transcript_32544/g.46255 Transcript_32544/m.46255 type:complete len:218 (+) Transcript_32544:250-903(+)